MDNQKEKNSLEKKAECNACITGNEKEFQNPLLIEDNIKQQLLEIKT